ncbi:4-hydroxy-tetrahydrodipicolinate synthase [Armatimonas sp.]|uniref:4-hydroxy-tetrahydrodipicolinate synthase n=1 Tax=Armatimonas sp. TaxID=1872638 RepID=UPI00286AED72|nr:4-hydroxy-tetrahydrodipicolinate synthase [Armatimonas sp.]
MQPRWGYIVTAMVTPFDQNNAVDFAEAVALAKWLLANGSDALVINGTTGESPTTSPKEKAALVKVIVEAIGAEKVIAGVGGNNTAEVIEAAHDAKAAGAGALLAVVPYYNKPSQEGLYQHFKTVASATDLPVMLYNVPARTITNLEPATVVRLAADCPTIVAIKEASANLQQVGEILRQTPESFDVYSGDDGTILSLLALGGCGLVSVISHVIGPELQAVHQAWFAGKQAEAAEIFLRTLPVAKTMFSVPSPAPTKQALRALGKNVGPVRLPLVDCNAQESEAILGVLRGHGLLV